MIRLSNIKLPLDYTDSDIKKACAKELRISEQAIEKASLYRRSIDARHKDDIRYVTSVDVHLNTNEKSAVFKRNESKNGTV